MRTTSPTLEGPPSTASLAALPPITTHQGTMFGCQHPEVTALAPRRIALDATSWIDHQHEWLLGGDQIFDELTDGLPWEAGRRPMYDRMVDVPRLTAFLPTTDPRFPGIVGHAAAILGHHYQATFSLVGASYYRDGNDSVAWHRDRIGRIERNPIIAVVSLGGCRNFRLRSRAETSDSHTVPMYSGDVLVMGGACQHRWEHAVPKMATTEPRMSLTFRHADGRTATDPLRTIATRPVSARARRP